MGVNPFEVERESYKRDKSRSIYNEILNRWICIALYNTGNMELQEFNEGVLRIPKRQERNLGS